MDTITDTTALGVATVLTLIGLVAACLRLFLGPSRSDRVVALDLITVLLIAISSLAALRFDDAAYLDLGLTLALVGFLATVAFARYVESEPAADGRATRTVDPSASPGDEAIRSEDRSETRSDIRPAAPVGSAPAAVDPAATGADPTGSRAPISRANDGSET